MAQRQMTLEEQLAALDAIGIRLSAEATVDDLLYSYDRSEYESKPFDALLFILGCEIERRPWGRSFSNVAWNFDAECIVENGDYAHVVKRLAELAGLSDNVTDIMDSVDLDAGTATLQYTIRGQTRVLSPTVSDDWADPKIIDVMLADFEHDGYHFYGIDNGQSTILYYLDDATASKLRSLATDPVVRMIPPSQG